MLVNIKNYFAPLLALIEHFVNEGFAGAHVTELYHLAPTVEDAIAIFLADQAARKSRTPILTAVEVAAPHGPEGAPSRYSLKQMESDSASKEASTMFSETPTVDQRLPAPSALSIITRVTASVPPVRIRTL